ncbi:MAG TPA: hypothetical protein PKG79_09255 [Propioniciclava tarda]|nr:hypothetical protein [Propioniciclava tarda]
MPSTSAMATTATVCALAVATATAVAVPAAAADVSPTSSANLLTSVPSEALAFTTITQGKRFVLNEAVQLSSVQHAAEKAAADQAAAAAAAGQAGTADKAAADKAAADKAAKAAADKAAAAKAAADKAAAAKSAAAKAAVTKTSGTSAVAVPAAPVAEVATGSSPFGSASKYGLKGGAVKTYYVITSLFPGINSVGGYRPSSLSNHQKGLAIDFMLTQGAESALGWTIAKYAAAHAGELNINHIIFEQRIWTPRNPTWRMMENRGSATANHMDHVHISMNS